MKKIKNTELKVNISSLANVKEGNIKRKKLKNINKLKDAVDKTEELSLAPQKTTAESKLNVDNIPKSRKKSKSISADQEENQQLKEEDCKAANSAIKTSKQKKKLANNEQENPPTKGASNNLTEAELKKVEKKRAKKLAQKLRKQQRKAEGKSQNKSTDSNTNGVEKIKEPDTDATKNFETTSTKVLAKKEKRAERRQIVKDKKLAEKQNRDPALEASTVFVGNLPTNTKRVQLARLFKKFAPVNSIRLRTGGGKVLYKHKQRKTSGCLNAYVVLKSKETAEKALSLNGVEFKGNHLRVTMAAKSPLNPEKEDAKRTIFVGNLKYSANEESLREIFSSCGEIDYIRCLRDGDKGCKGVAYVCFKTVDAVGLALELNHTILDERPINVERFSVKKLGAKEAREALAEKLEKSKMGAKQRIDSKKEKKGNPVLKKNDHGDGDEAKKSKKSEFRGVKVEGLKQKQKLKKKKSNDQMLQLARKIAPKIKI